MDQVIEAVLKEYKETGFNVVPLFPSVLIRVLPNPLKTSSGLLHLPEDHNKGNHNVLYEGIVIRSYEPKTTVFQGKEIRYDSGLESGDHVIFPHWSGEPVQGLDDEKYRLVPQRGVRSQAGDRSSGEVLGILKKAEKLTVDTLTVKMLTHMHETSATSPESICRMFATKLLRNYEFIERITEPTVKK